MMQEYERVTSEPEETFARHGARDRWSEGEKLQAEPKRQNHLGRGSSRTTIIMTVIIVIAVLCVLFFLLGAVSFVHVSSGTFPGGGPGPIQHTIPHKILYP
jgi:hypothetical protein